MATLKSIIRTANTSYKSSVREIERRFKESAKRCLQNLKQQIAMHDAAAINTYNEYINLLLTVHEEYSDTLDWDSFTNEQEPERPVFWPIWENEAHFTLKRYEPSFLDIVTGQYRVKIRSLRRKLEEARAEDEEVHLFNQKNYFKNKGDWELVQILKNGIKKSDPAAYKAAIDFFDPYAKITHLGSSLIYDIHSDYINIDVHIDGAAIIPEYTFTRTESGNLTRNKLSSKRFNKIYHHYVCGCALLLARETFALLPVRYLCVNMIESPLNALHGDMENRTILSVKFDPDVMKQDNEHALNCLKVLIDVPERIPFSVINNFPTKERIENEGDLAS